MRAVADTDFDLLQFGATGFAGGLTAEYLARHAPANLRWALAGRNAAGLQAVAAKLAKIAPDRPTPEIIEIGLGDQAKLQELVARTRLVFTSVGPYAIHGEPLVAAAAATGADYVDITGESQFVDEMFMRYHDQAVASGARLVHCAGFDSVPHDLGALFAVRQFSGDEPVKLTGAVYTSMEISGGTYHSALGAIAAFRESLRLTARRRQIEAATAPKGRKISGTPSIPKRDSLTGDWLLPLPTIDPQIVARSATALPEYGPDFSYAHAIATRRFLSAAGIAIGVTSLALAATIGPVRKQLGKLRAPGAGPSAERRARSWFTVRMTGTAPSGLAVIEVRGGDPGYDETSKMAAETSLCLLLDENPPTSGQVTTAVACGDALLTRLQAAGMTFTVVRAPASRVGSSTPAAVSG